MRTFFFVVAMLCGLNSIGHTILGEGFQASILSGIGLLLFGVGELLHRTKGAQ